MYVHGAIGTCNDHELVQKTGIKRDINRGMIDSRIIADTLKEPNSKSSLIRKEASRLYLIRTRQRAFHPHGDQRVLMISPDVFAVLRTSPEEDQHILTMTNVTCRECNIEVPLSELSVEETRWYDLINGKEWVATNAKLSIVLQPYDVVWLKPYSEME